MLVQTELYEALRKAGVPVASAAAAAHAVRGSGGSAADTATARWRLVATAVAGVQDGLHLAVGVDRDQVFKHLPRARSLAHSR